MKIKPKLEFEKYLKQRLEFICEFSKVTPTFKRRKKAMNNELPKTKIDERTGI